MRLFRAIFEGYLGRVLEGFWKVSGRFLEGFWKVFGRFLDLSLLFFERFLEGFVFRGFW